MIELSKVIRDLRHELQEAVVSAADEPLRFELQDIELEVQLAVEASGKTGGKVRFWVVDLDAEAAGKRTSTQRVKIALKPTLVVNGQQHSAYVSGPAADDED